MTEETRNPETAEQTEEVKGESFPVNPNMLKTVRITSLNGKVHVVGTDKAEIFVRVVTDENKVLVPKVEIKRDGELADINMESGFQIPKFARQIKLNLGDKEGGTKLKFDLELDDDPDEYTEEEFENDDNEEHRFEYGPHYHQQKRIEHEAKRRAQQALREEMRRVREKLRSVNRKGRWGIKFNDFELNTETLDQILQEVSENISFIFDPNASLYVEVPHQVSLEIRSVSGEVKVSNIDGMCKLDNASGDARFKNIRGGLRIRGMSGDYRARNIGGRVWVRVASGSVDLRRCNLDGLDLSVTSGSARVQTTLTDSEEDVFRLNSTSGEIRLAIPESSRASLDCRTLSGGISIPRQLKPAEIRNRPGQSFIRLELNGGGRKVLMNNISGGIEFKLYNPAGAESDSETEEWELGNTENWGFSGQPAGWPAGAVPPVPPTPPVPPVPPVPPMPNGFGFAPPVPPAPGFGFPPATPPAPTTGWPATFKQESQAQEPVSEPAKVPAVEENQSTAKPTVDKQTRQLEILQAIERGELSIEDGMAYLSEIED